MCSSAPTTLKRALGSLVLWMAIGWGSALADKSDESRVCSLGWGINAVTLFVQFKLLMIVTRGHAEPVFIYVASMQRRASALASACWQFSKSMCTRSPVHFKRLLDAALLNEENCLDAQSVMTEGTPYLDKLSIDWVSMAKRGEPKGSSTRLHIITGMTMKLGGLLLDADNAKSHAVFWNGEQQEAEPCLQQRAFTLPGAKRMKSSWLHLVMIINVLLAMSNTVGALLWLAKLPSIVGAAYATSRLGMKALGLGLLQWRAAKLSERLYLLEGSDLEDIQTRCQHLTIKRIWNLSDLCGKCNEEGKSTWWLIDIERYDARECRLARGGMYWSSAPRWVESIINKPYCIPAGCGFIGYLMFIWPYCWIITAPVVVVLGMDWIARFSCNFILIKYWGVVIWMVACILFYDMFIVAAGLVYTGVPYWEVVRRTYDAGDTECVFRDKFTTTAEFLTLN